jgi:hypothetical protein
VCVCRLWLTFVVEEVFVLVTMVVVIVIMMEVKAIMRAKWSIFGY